MRISLRALTSLIAGILLIMTPFLIAEEGYSGAVLVADERIGPPFDKALILIDRHDIEGAVGIILNKPLSDGQQAQLSAFIRDAGIPVGYGGPLGFSERIFVLEEKKPAKPGGKLRFDLYDWDDAVRTTPDLLNKIRQSIKSGEQRYRVFTGLSSWAPFQLESEVLAKGEWHTVPASHDMIYQNNSAVRWDALERQEKTKKTPDQNQS